jgi:hypothetical protein
MAMPRLDLNLAWADTIAALRAHKELLIPIIGIFVFLPIAILGMWTGQIEISQNSTQAQIDSATAAFIKDNVLWIVILGLIVQFGTLVIYILLLAPGNLTVSAALNSAIKFIPTAIAVGLIYNLAITLPNLLPFAKNDGFIAFLFLFRLFAIYITIRLVLPNCVIAAEAQANPINALKRSWELTSGHFARLFAYLLLLFILALVLLFVVCLLPSAMLYWVMPISTAQGISSIWLGICASAIYLIFILVAAGLYRQLSAHQSATL